MDNDTCSEYLSGLPPRSSAPAELCTHSREGIGGVLNTVWATIISLTAPAMPSTPFLPRSGTTSALLIRWLKLLLFRNLFTFAITLQFNPARNPNSSRPTKERLVRFCREPCAAALPRRSLLLRHGLVPVRKRSHRTDRGGRRGCTHPLMKRHRFPR